MSYLTLEAEIQGGKVLVKEPEKLPETARALVTILESDSPPFALTSPLAALEALQQHLQLDERKAAEWMETVRAARR